MSLNLGISTMVYYHENIEKLLPYLAEWQIKLIEIKPHIGHFEYQDINMIDQLKKQLDHLNILVKAIHMPINGVDISHPQEYDRVRSIREIEKTIMVALRLGAKLIVIHPGGSCSSPDDREKRMYHCVNSLTEILEFCQPWNIKLAIENTLPGRLGDRWEEIKQIIERIPSEDLGICFDSGHYFLNQKHDERGGLNLDKEPINWQKYLLHMHIHDNDGKEDLHLLPGGGCFPWVSLISYLKEIQYQGALIIELKEQLQLPQYLDKIKDTFDQLEAFAKR